MYNNVPNKKYETLLLEGQLASPGLVSGTFFLHPRGFFIWEIIQNFLNKEFKKIGIENVLFPGLIPLSKFLEEQKINNTLNLEEIIKIHSEKKNIESIFALRPTSEILFTHFFKERIKENSYKLPILLNQWSSVYREEKNTKLFFRSKEFYWQEMHSIHEKEEEAKNYLEKVHLIYKKLIIELLCIYPISGEKTFLERFPGAEITLSNECILPDGQVLQLTTSHYLGNFFSGLLKISKEKELIQLSAGCSTRLIGALIEMHKDSSGIILPWDLSKDQIVILILNDCLKKEKIKEVIFQLKNSLSDYRFSIDDSNNSFGKKINKFEKLGIPLMLIIGNEELKENNITIKSRLSNEKYKLSLYKIKEEVLKIKVSFNKELLERSKKYSSDLIEEVYDWEELVKLVSFGKVVIAPWKNSIENESNFLGKKYNFSIRCIKEKLSESSNLNCVFSNNKADCLVYFGRSY